MISARWPITLSAKGDETYQDIISSVIVGCSLLTGHNVPGRRGI